MIRTYKMTEHNGDRVYFNEDEARSLIFGGATSFVFKKIKFETDESGGRLYVEYKLTHPWTPWEEMVTLEFGFSNDFARGKKGITGLAKIKRESGKGETENYQVAITGWTGIPFLEIAVKPGWPLYDENYGIVPGLPEVENALDFVTRLEQAEKSAGDYHLVPAGEVL